MIVNRPPFGSPFVSPFASPFAGASIQTPQMNVLPPPPEASLKRSLNYYADYSGCGFWRMIWPEHLLNAHQKMIVHGSTVMVLEPSYYRGIKTVRIQRQATSHQLEFVRHLKKISEQAGFKLIYEIDDLVFSEDIPEYNKFKPAFTDPQIRKNCQEIMEMCDEITVTCNFMRDYYKSKTRNQNVTVIPNYPPKWWMGNFYSEKRISENFDAYEEKPRILYAGSGAHFDVDNRVNQNDDFAHVINTVAKTVDKYQWVFLGAFPLRLQELVRAGKIEFHPWAQLYNYPEKIYNLKINMMVAPLQDSTFNKAKSDLKYIEASCFGLPIACQDLCTYEDAPIKFRTGDEMIDQIDATLSKKGKYMNICAKARKVAESRFLENEENISKYYELYTFPYKDSERKYLNSVNA
jgi:glycosyltransferase involved in cell wall biosynthesis